MVLIADSGSTKTEWVRLEDQFKKQYFHCIGLNPITVSDNQIKTEIRATFPDKNSRLSISNIFFFGAGCWNKETCGLIEKELIALFPNASIQVESDLIGAVKATCGNQAGITCILGTGSNSCSYDGQQIMDAIPSLGYQLGDEGSGAYLGKELIKSFFYRELPKDLEEHFQRIYCLQKGDVIDKVYRKAHANRYLASFTPFLSDHLQHPFVRSLLKSSFEEFLVRHVFKYGQYQTLPIHFVGSIAYHFQEPLKDCLEQYQLCVGNILKTPIEGLELYFRDILDGF